MDEVKFEVTEELLQYLPGEGTKTPQLVYHCVLKMKYLQTERVNYVYCSLLLLLLLTKKCSAEKLFRIDKIGVGYRGSDCFQRDGNEIVVAGDYAVETHGVKGDVHDRGHRIEH